jgi:hypothetical protein
VTVTDIVQHGKGGSGGNKGDYKLNWGSALHKKEKKKEKRDYKYRCESFFCMDRDFMALQLWHGCGSRLDGGFASGRSRRARHARLRQAGLRGGLDLLRRRGIDIVILALALRVVVGAGTLLAAVPVVVVVVAAGLLDDAAIVARAEQNSDPAVIVMRRPSNSNAGRVRPTVSPSMISALSSAWDSSLDVGQFSILNASSSAPATGGRVSPCVSAAGIDKNRTLDLSLVLFVVVVLLLAKCQ